MLEVPAMSAPVQTKPGLTGNQLKIIAMIAMTCDHVGLQLFPQLTWLRWIGRLALPVYAYMIAEGCRHTRSRKKYLLRLASMAALCQIVYFFAMNSLYQCILVTFSLSVSIICIVDGLSRLEGARRLFVGPLASIAVAAGSCFVCFILPLLVEGFAIDYGIWGVMLPVMLYYGKKKWVWLTAGLVLLAFAYGGDQWLALAAVPLLQCYNGQRGAANIGRLFYWYYPLHLVVIYGISLIL